MKLIIESEPKEIAALVAELQEQQRPIILPGVGIEKFLQENPDFIKEAEPLARDDMGTLVARYPENFTGEVFVVPDPTPEQLVKSAALMAELETLAAPLVEWIRKNHGPHTEVHISWDHAWVRHEGMGIPFPYSEM